MGTSSRHPGSSDRSPLVPPHADAEPGKPLPDPPPKRFKQFRTSLGNFANSGDRGALEKSLQFYASKATGGPSVGPRRFGTAITTGGALLGGLTAIGSGGSVADSLEGTAYDDATISRIHDAIGRPINEAIQILSDAFAPTGEESDKVREALVCALSESLEDKGETFNAEILDEEIYTDTLICFLAEIIFIDIYNESGDAFERIDSAAELELRENELREIVKVAVDLHLSRYLDDGILGLSHEQIREIQFTALKDVFSEWDGLV